MSGSRTHGLFGRRLRWIWPVWIMLAFVSSMAEAGGRAALIQSGDLGEFGSGVDSAVQVELERRGWVTLRVPEAAGRVQEGVFPREIRRIAFEQEADVVLVGQGDPGSDGEGGQYELGIYSGQSGVRLGRRARSVTDGVPDPGEARVWADWVVEVLALPDGRSQTVARKAPSRQIESDPEAGGLDDLLRFRGPERGAPLKIDAESLEVLGMDDRTRRIRFVGEVRAELGEMILRAEELEAFYRAGDSEPERLNAEGNVRIDQGDRQALCQRAEYSRLDDKVVCMGDAVLIHGCDRVRGERIEMELGRDRARVEGAASVEIVPEGSEAGSGCKKSGR